MAQTPICLLYRGPYKPPFGDCAIYSQPTSKKFCRCVHAGHTGSLFNNSIPQPPAAPSLVVASPPVLPPDPFPHQKTIGSSKLGRRRSENRNLVEMESRLGYEPFYLNSTEDVFLSPTSVAVVVYARKRMKIL